MDFCLNKTKCEDFTLCTSGRHGQDILLYIFSYRICKIHN